MYKLIIFVLSLFIAATGVAAKEAFLKPDQAYPVSAKAADDKVIVHWDIADGYYLYRNKFRFSSKTNDVTLGDPDLPPGKTKVDPFFGEIEIYRKAVDIELPVRFPGKMPDLLELEVKSQGCADAGICYPPHRQKLIVALDNSIDAPPPVPDAAVESVTDTLMPSRGSDTAELPSTQAAIANNASALDALASLGDDLGLGEGDFLTADQAYKPSVEVVDGSRLKVHWDIADDTYLYEDKVSVTLQGDGVALGKYALPPAKIKHNSVKPDGSLGDVPVFVHSLDLDIPLLRSNTNATSATVTLKYQGCDGKQGICYPPKNKTFPVQLPPVGKPAASAAPPKPQLAAKSAAVTPAPAPVAVELSEQDQIASLLRNKSAWLVIISFFGLGLLLSLTPCVFPMIPILSGIIAGQGSNITARKAFVLSVVFVLAMAVTYTIAGVLAGLFGSNLQAAFQNPWILSAFAILFVALALSMFGFYELQLPASWQSKLSEISNRQQGGQLSGVAIMGLLSALIVGPCVAPPLAGALIFIGQTGDWLLGGLALFFMSLGMGAPLILIGTSAGKFLPKAGGWMEVVKAVFGVVMLGLAITMLERFLPEIYTMSLWGILLTVSAIYMGATQPLPAEASGWRKLWKGLGVVLLIYGALFLVGVATNGKDNLQPLRGLALGNGGPAVEAPLSFKRIKSMGDLQRELAGAKAAGKPVMLDFYADWCIYCKQMEKNVFPDPKVRAALSRFVLLQADVTAQDETDNALMQGLNIPAPPAMLFWSRKGEEIHHLRIMGYKNAEDFSKHVKKVP